MPASVTPDEDNIPQMSQPLKAVAVSDKIFDTKRLIDTKSVLCIQEWPMFSVDRPAIPFDSEPANPDRSEQGRDL